MQRFDDVLIKLVEQPGRECNQGFYYKQLSTVYGDNRVFVVLKLKNYGLIQIQLKFC